MFDSEGDTRSGSRGEAEGGTSGAPGADPSDSEAGPAGYGACDDDGLVEALVQVGCLESATRLELVRLAAEADARSGPRMAFRASRHSWSCAWACDGEAPPRWPGSLG